MTHSSRSRRMVRWLIAAGLAIVGAGTASAQGQTAVITGRLLTRQGQPLNGANVFTTEMNVSVGTNSAGRYTITIPGERVRGQNATLRIRSIGYKQDSR